MGIATYKIFESKATLVRLVVASLLSLGIILFHRFGNPPVQTVMAIYLMVVAFSMWAVYGACKLIAIKPMPWMLSTAIPLIGIFTMSNLLAKVWDFLDALQLNEDDN